MRETVKVVNGYAITKMVGTKGCYRVYIRKNVFCTFRTIKAAAEYCESL